MIDLLFFLGRRRPLLGSLAIAIALAATGARAQDQESVFRSIAKQTGFATDPSPPPDFVVKSRATAPTEVLPVFTTPDEPSSKVLTPRQLKAMDADLEGAGKKHDVLRAGFAPSAKAVAEAKAAAAEKAKRKKKPPPTPANPAF